MWGRLSLTRIWWQSLDRIGEQFKAADVDMQVYVAGSESAHQALCVDHRGHWIESSNDRLGLKWDTVAKAALASGADYILILGSDDFVSPGLIPEYVNLMRQGTAFAGVQAVYVADQQSGRVMLLDTQKRLREVTYEEAKGKCTIVDLDRKPPDQDLFERGLVVLTHSLTLGAGRLVHRSLFEGREYFWEHDRCRALDSDFERNLQLPVPQVIPTSSTDFIADVKTGQNIWNFDTLDASFPDCLLSEQEAQCLNALPEWSALQELP